MRLAGTRLAIESRPTFLGALIMASEMPLPNNPVIPPVGKTNDSATGTGGMDPAAMERRFERVVTSAHEAVDTAAVSVQQAAEKLRTQAQRFSDFEEEAAEACRARVRENPLAYLAGAVLVGVLIGRLSR
jgi:ElaB/YqjD/DUF883 family membrane-anchored ribosome-binding protein